MLVLISMVKEVWPLLLGAECVLERLSGRVVAPSMYPFNELFCFGCLYSAIFEIIICGCEWWFQHVLKYQLRKAFQEKVDCFFIPYSVAGEAC